MVMFEEITQEMMLQELFLPQGQSGLGRRAEQSQKSSTPRSQKRLKPCMLLTLRLKILCYNSQVFYKDKISPSQQILLECKNYTEQNQPQNCKSRERKIA